MADDETAIWVATYNHRLAEVEATLAQVQSFVEAIQVFQNRCAEKNASFETVHARFDALIPAPASALGSSAAHLASQHAAAIDQQPDMDQYGAAIDALQAELVVLESDLGVGHKESLYMAAAIRDLRAHVAMDSNVRARHHFPLLALARSEALELTEKCIEKLHGEMDACAESICHQRYLCACADGDQARTRLWIMADDMAMRHGVWPSVEFIQAPSQASLTILQEQAEETSGMWTSQRRRFRQLRMGIQQRLLSEQLEKRNSLEGVISQEKKSQNGSLELVDDFLEELKSSIVQIKAAEVSEALKTWVELVDVPGLGNSSGSSSPDSTESQWEETELNLSSSEGPGQDDG